MSIKDIVNNLSTTIESYNPSQIITILLVALLGGLLIFVTYRYTSDASVYNRSFNVGNVVIALITAVIMMMISSNIIISLGMVGALSIVRFRTALKEPRDTVFIFWSIVLGLCAGSQNFILAAISSLFICAILFLFSLPFWRFKASSTLIVRAQADSSDAVEKTIRRSVRHYRMRAAHTAGDNVELVYKIRGGKVRPIDMLRALTAIEGVHQANLSEVDEP